MLCCCWFLHHKCNECCFVHSIKHVWIQNTIQNRFLVSRRLSEWLFREMPVFHNECLLCFLDTEMQWYNTKHNTSTDSTIFYERNMHQHIIFNNEIISRRFNFYFFHSWWKYTFSSLIVFFSILKVWSDDKAIISHQTDWNAKFISVNMKQSLKQILYSICFSFPSDFLFCDCCLNLGPQVFHNVRLKTQKLLQVRRLRVNVPISVCILICLWFMLTQIHGDSSVSNWFLPFCSIGVNPNENELWNIN